VVISADIFTQCEKIFGYRFEKISNIGIKKKEYSIGSRPLLSF
jgi:hypothetical protein